MERRCYRMVLVREIDLTGYRLAQLIVAYPHDVLDGSADKGLPMLHVNVVLRLDNAEPGCIGFPGIGTPQNSGSYLIPSMKLQADRSLDKMPKRLIVCCDGNILLNDVNNIHRALRGRPDIDEHRSPGHLTERLVRRQPHQPRPGGRQDLVDRVRSRRPPRHHAAAPSVSSLTSPPGVRS